MAKKRINKCIELLEQGENLYYTGTGPLTYENGEKQEKAMFGLECRIFQHEYDHMEGINFTKKVSRLRLNMARRRQKKQAKKSILSRT